MNVQMDREEKSWKIWKNFFQYVFLGKRGFYFINGFPVMGRKKSMYEFFNELKTLACGPIQLIINVNNTCS